MDDPIPDSHPFAPFVYSHEGRQYVDRNDYERLRDMMRWIPCDERMPNDGDEVLPGSSCRIRRPRRQVLVSQWRLGHPDPLDAAARAAGGEVMPIAIHADERKFRLAIKRIAEALCRLGKRVGGKMGENEIMNEWRRTKSFKCGGPCANEAAEMSAWIPVTERLPEMLAEVLVSYGRVRKSVLVAHYEPYPEDAGDHWVGQCGCRLESKEVTHWHPLPKPPEVK